jgi:hypothetical protein
MNAKISYTVAILVFISTALTLAGCGTGKVHFRRMVSASELFEQHRVLPGHQYYYFGRPHAPLAVVAIQQDYRLISAKWNPIDGDESVIKDLVARMRNQPGSEYNVDPNGAHILNNDGEIIGFWYSVWRLPVLQFTGENEFTISDPVTIFPYNNREPDDDPILPD